MTKHYEQRKAANERYLAKLEQIQIRVEAGGKDKIKTHAESIGESVNAFINRAIEEAMIRDNKRKTEG